MSGTRSFIRILQEVCSEEGILREGFSGDLAQRFSKDGKQAFTVGYQFDLNSSAVRELCKDKALTSELLLAAGVPVSEHVFLELGVTGAEERIRAHTALCAEYLEKYGKIVLKDNYGTGGNKVFLADSAEEAEKTLFALQAQTYAAALSPYYEIREEYRVVMLDGEPQLVIRKERESRMEDGKKVYVNWKHNLGQGAVGIPVDDPDITAPLFTIAKQALSVIPARFASVDVIETADALLVLEINSGVMLEHFSSQDEECYRRGKAVYRAALLKMLA